MERTADASSVHPLRPTSRRAQTQAGSCGLHPGPAPSLARRGTGLSLGHAAPTPCQPKAAPARRKQPSVEDKHGLAVALAREGFDGKACAALLSTGLAPATPDAVRQLRAVHPAGPRPQTAALTALPPPPELAPDLVAKCLRSFPAGSAPGPSGLRPQHIMEACPPGMLHGLIAQCCS
jgi:hypothetical protein